MSTLLLPRRKELEKLPQQNHKRVIRKRKSSFGRAVNEQFYGKKGRGKKAGKMCPLQTHAAFFKSLSDFINPVSWFNPSQQLSTTQPLAPSPRGGMGERLGRVKVRKLVAWGKDNLICKAKAAHASKAKQGVHSPLPIGRQVFSHLQESRAPSCVKVT